MNVGSNPGKHLYNIVQMLYHEVGLEVSVTKVGLEVSVTKVGLEVKTWTIVKSEIDPDDSVLRMKLWRKECNINNLT
jgi:heterodisulfide reductase subunit B